MEVDLRCVGSWQVDVPLETSTDAPYRLVAHQEAVARAGDLARHWRAGPPLQHLCIESRLREPTRSVSCAGTPNAVQSQCGAPPQPVFKLGDSDELQPATPNPAQLRRDVLIEEVPAAAECLRSLTRP